MCKSYDSTIKFNIGNLLNDFFEEHKNTVNEDDKSQITIKDKYYCYLDDLTDFYQKNKQNEVADMFISINKMVKVLENDTNKADLGPLFYMGAIKGSSDMFEKINEVDTDRRNIDELVMKLNSMDKWKRILEQLDKNCTMQHKVLAKEIGVTVNHLSELTSKMEKEKLIEKRRISKYSFYNITKLGEEVLNKYGKENPSYFSNKTQRKVQLVLEPAAAVSGQRSAQRIIQSIALQKKLDSQFKEISDKEADIISILVKNMLDTKSAHNSAYRSGRVSTRKCILNNLQKGKNVELDTFENTISKQSRLPGLNLKEKSQSIKSVRQRIFENNVYC